MVVHQDNLLVIYQNDEDIISMLYNDMVKMVSQLEYHQLNFSKNDVAKIVFGFGDTFSLLDNLDEQPHYLILFNTTRNKTIIYKCNIDKQNMLSIQTYYLNKSDDNKWFQQIIKKEN